MVRRINFNNFPIKIPYLDFCCGRVQASSPAKWFASKWAEVNRKWPTTIVRPLLSRPESHGLVRRNACSGETFEQKFKKIKTSAESKGALSYNYLRLDLSFQDRRGEKFISVILEILVGGWLRLLCIGMVSEDLHIPFWNFQRIEHFS